MLQSRYLTCVLCQGTVATWQEIYKLEERKGVRTSLMDLPAKRY